MCDAAAVVAAAAFSGFANFLGHPHAHIHIHTHTCKQLAHNIPLHSKSLGGARSASIYRWPGASGEQFHT
jgi:hypothetical protein